MTTLSLPSHVVGIGASAGGLDALERFFANMPTPNGMAFIVVQHLSPDFKSLMDQLLARHTSMAIHRIEDGMPVEADAVYLIPPRQELLLEHGQLHLAEHSGSMRGRHLPIDTFLASLAEAMGEKAVGIVLSGTGSDGTRGIQALKEAGGMVMVQSPDTAQFDGMPRSALATGLADYALAPEHMPAALLTYTQHPLGHEDTHSDALPLPAEDTLTELMTRLRQVQGIDFTHYKSTTIGRRLQRRWRLVNVATMDAYMHLLRTSPQELSALHHDLLIGVTSFFRDPEAFTVLEHEVMLPLLHGASPHDPLRVWVTACSTGEEAYTIAMLLREHLDALDRALEVQLFATDIDRQAVEFAAKGVYPESIAADVGPERLQRFFTSDGSRYRVARDLREMIIFAPHNLMIDPPFTKMHLVSCRNCLIYLDQPVQQRVLGLLHYALQPQGFLFLGPSESVGELAAACRVVHHKWKVFQKVHDVRPPIGARQPTPLSPPVPHPAVSRHDRRGDQATDPLLFQAYVRLVETSCPPTLVVSDTYEILRIIGQASDYLKRPSGTPSLHVLQVVSDDLALPLATALHKAAKDKTDVAYRDVRVRLKEAVQRLTLRVQWLPGHAPGRHIFLVAFEAARPVTPVAVEAESFDVESQAAQRLLDLEHELQYTRESLQAAIEELETSNEELQATNEEMVAANEELQSTNEELQSVNEELHTVNAEYHSNIQELTALTADMDNLLRSTDLGVIFLDQELRLRKFTPAVTAFVSLLEHDLGRRMSHFAHCFAPLDVQHDAQEVLRTGVPIERELRTRTDAWLFVRLLPFVNAAGVPEGVVLTCTDVTPIKQAEEAVKQSQGQLQEVLDNAPAAIYIKDTAGRYLLVDRQYEALLNLSSADFLGKTVYDLYPQEVAEALAAHDQQVLEANTPLTFEEIGPASAEGPRTFLSVKFPLRDATGAPYALCGISTEITERKRIEEALYHAKEELEHRVQEFSRLTAILEATTDVVGIADTHDHVMYLNAAGRRLLGVQADETIGLSVSAFIPSWAMSTIREEGVPTAMQEGTWAGETALIDRDGREIPVSQVIIAHTSASGNLTSFSTIMRDITAEKEARDLLRHRAEEMEAFAYSASHDLQAPLRTFEGYARWLLEDYSEVLGAAGRQLCEEIIADAMHMKTLLDGLLEYSRIGRHYVEPVLVDLKKVFDWVLHDLQLEILNTNATIHLAETFPTVVYPEARLTQIFSNLLSNAIKFTPPERVPEVTIGWQQQGRYYRFTVRDNGIGVAPEHCDRIFEIFRRLHTREAYPGTGVGLTIVKKIVESHGGQIGVDSTPGEGSTFWFTVPKLALPCSTP